MDKAIKERIIEFNNRLGLSTEFIEADESILGYAENNTIYINESVEQDYEKTNKHEVLHFFEDTPEFQELKQSMLDSIEDRLEQVKEKYELRYYGIYSEEEIAAGVLDNEIVIDLLVDNSIIDFDNGLIIGDKLLGEIEKGLEERRYLTLTVRNNVQQMNLTDWEKIFVENYYDGKIHVMPRADKKRGKTIEGAIREDIKKCLDELYSLKESDFAIDSKSSEIEREHKNEIAALEARGEDVEEIKSLDEDFLLQERADKHKKILYGQYSHIVNRMKELTDYDDAFKALMLMETLTKTYKLDDKDGKRQTIVKKRDRKKSLAGHMVLNEGILKSINEKKDRLTDYSNFAKLYFEALEEYRKKVAEMVNVSFENVDTYDMGKWLKFEGRISNEDEYLENAERLAALVKDTPWCTKDAAAGQLLDGDFYVFVDNEGAPHIAVRMEGERIGEVRGIANQQKQEIEAEYYKVVVSFLEKNKEIEGGMEWLENENWNERLRNYLKDINDGTFSKDEVPQMMNDISINSALDQSGINSNKEKLLNALPKIKDTIVEYYGCAEDELFVGNVNLENDLKRSDYKIIIGNLYIGRGIDISRLVSIDYVQGMVSGLERINLSGNEDELIRKCLEKRDALNLSSNNVAVLISKSNSFEFIVEFIEKRKEYNFDSDDVTRLILATKNPNFIEKCITEKCKEYELSTKQVLNLVEATEDSNFIIEYIEKKREELQLNASSISKLIIATKDSKYIEKCLREKWEEYKLNSLDSEELFKMILATENSAFYMECIDRREELGLANSSKVQRLINRIKEPNLIIQCIKRKDELGLLPSDVTSLMKKLDKTTVKKFLEENKDIKYRGEEVCCLAELIDEHDETIKLLEEYSWKLTPDDIANLLKLTRDPKYIRKYIGENKDSDHLCQRGIVFEVIEETKDPEYMKYCIEHYKDYADKRFLRMKNDRRQKKELVILKVYSLIKATEDTDYIRSCVERIDEMGLDSDEIGNLVIATKDPHFISDWIAEREKNGLEVDNSVREALSKLLEELNKENKEHHGEEAKIFSESKESIKAEEIIKQEQLKDKNDKNVED